MTYATYGEMKTQLDKELDLQQQSFVVDTEKMGYYNQAINRVEARILTINEEYFLNKTSITLVVGTSDYDLPSDIYATKIRGVVYNDGAGTIYPVKKFRRHNKFINLELSRENTGDDYKYTIYNPSAATGVQFEIIPTSRVAGAYIKIYYIRNANKIIADATPCDIPEFSEVIQAYVRWRVMRKEGHPDMAASKEDLDELEKNMEDTLTNMIIDDDNEVEKDFSHYEESA